MRSEDVGSESHEIQRGPRSRDSGSGDSESVGCEMWHTAHVLRYSTTYVVWDHACMGMYVGGDV